MLPFSHFFFGLVLFLLSYMCSYILRKLMVRQHVMMGARDGGAVHLRAASGLERQTGRVCGPNTLLRVYPKRLTSSSPHFPEV